MSETVPYRTAIGYEYPVFDVVVTEAEQRRLHGHCGIAETVYGDSGEAAVFVTPYLPDRYTEAQALSESKVLSRVLRIERMNER